MAADYRIGQDTAGQRRQRCDNRASTVCVVRRDHRSDSGGRCGRHWMPGAEGQDGPLGRARRSSGRSIPARAVVRPFLGRGGGRPAARASRPERCRSNRSGSGGEDLLAPAQRSWFCTPVSPARPCLPRPGGGDVAGPGRTPPAPPEFGGARGGRSSSGSYRASGGGLQGCPRGVSDPGWPRPPNAAPFARPVALHCGKPVWSWRRGTRGGGRRVCHGAPATTAQDHSSLAFLDCS